MATGRARRTSANDSPSFTAARASTISPVGSSRAASLTSTLMAEKPSALSAT
jgi:hypothetical protein